ncbi:MAG: InlB B-repeat-containing protein [Oscillospiraceae bacterium]|jgi:uncharacterized repeat protein (TIGR02543 family)|nr:InlB B-repeat-containing protein [Oscillospiraceae bacterium]
MYKHLKRLLAGILVSLTLLLAFPAPVTASTTIPYYEWKQSYSQWGSDVIMKKTISQVGCLATSIAMLLVHADIKSESSFDPGAFVKAMKAVGGFDSNDNLNWYTVPTAYPAFELYNYKVELIGTKADKITKIYNYYKQGYYIIVAVKNAGHWVAVRSATSSSVTMMDPAAGTATNLYEKYDAAESTRIALFKAAKPANVYKVSYNANGGAGAPATQDKVHDTTLKLSSTKPTRSGYTFLGWATTKTATAAKYAAGGNYTDNAKVTLYAVWQSDTGASTTLPPPPTVISDPSTTIPDNWYEGMSLPAGSVSISKLNLSMTRDAKQQLSAAAGDGSAITWTSDDPDIVSVSETGELTALALGSTTITATAADGSRASCRVVVNRSFLEFLMYIFSFQWIQDLADMIQDALHPPAPATTEAPGSSASSATESTGSTAAAEESTAAPPTETPPPSTEPVTQPAPENQSQGS